MRMIGLLVLLTALATIAWWLRSSMHDGDHGGPRQRWFYDLTTHELFPGDMTSTPPIAAPSDSDGKRSGVLAIVVKTGAGTREIAYLMSTATPSQADSSVADSTTSWISLPDGKSWYPENSKEAEPIVLRARTLSGDSQITLEFPQD